MILWRPIGRLPTGNFSAILVNNISNLVLQICSFDPEFISQMKREIPRDLELVQNGTNGWDQVPKSRLYETRIERAIKRRENLMKRQNLIGD